MRRQAEHKRFVLMLKNVRRTTSRFEVAACQRRRGESGQMQGQIANLGAAKNGDRNNDHEVAAEHVRLCVQLPCCRSRDVLVLNNRPVLYFSFEECNHFFIFHFGERKMQKNATVHLEIAQSGLGYTFKSHELAMLFTKPTTFYFQKAPF